MTLRQEIEKIVDKYKGFRIYERSAEDLVDEVLEAIGKTVEGMPSVEAGVGNWAKGYYSGSIEQLKSDKAYWKEQVK